MLRQIDKFFLYECKHSERVRSRSVHKCESQAHITVEKWKLPHSFDIWWQMHASFVIHPEIHSFLFIISARNNDTKYHTNNQREREMSRKKTNTWNQTKRETFHVMILCVVFFFFCVLFRLQSLHCCAESNSFMQAKWMKNMW